MKFEVVFVVNDTREMKDMRLEVQAANEEDAIKAAKARIAEEYKKGGGEVHETERGTLVGEFKRTFCGFNAVEKD